MTNNRIEVVPGLVLDDEMFAHAERGIAEFAPEISFSFERFTNPAEWSLIPDEECGVVKAEMVLSRSIPATRKINVWFLPDLRDKGKPVPHSHPWPFTSRILMGGYSEDRYAVDGGVVHSEFDVSHSFGTANEVGKDLFHEVTDVHGEPGRTMTLMVCGPGKRGDWGYLDVATGRAAVVDPDPEFSSRWRKVNPHLV